MRLNAGRQANTASSKVENSAQFVHAEMYEWSYQGLGQLQSPVGRRVVVTLNRQVRVFLLQYTWWLGINLFFSVTDGGTK
jgi:hypothetical protein